MRAVVNVATGSYVKGQQPVYTNETNVVLVTK